MTMLTSSSSSLAPLLSLHQKPLSTTTTTAPPPIRLWFPSSSSRVSLYTSFSSVKQISSRFGSIRCQALGDNSVDPTTTPIYQGIYGPWSVDSADVRKVILYRAGLMSAATSFVITFGLVFYPPEML